MACHAPSITFKIQTTLKSYLLRAHIEVNKYQDFTLGTLGNLSSVFSSRDVANVAVSIVRPTSPVGTGQFKVQGSINGIDFTDLTTNISISNNDTILTTFSGKAFLTYRLIVGASGGGNAVCDVFWGANG